ncbi:MAG TPA: hypothetical protein VN772_04050 [Solirubrobacteraceae bacterium]|nr:hypothetical protein [Solirubrobacteraceae bacterium]
MSRPLTAAAALAACALVLAAAAAAANAPADPARNIPLGLLPGSCRGAPRGAGCENASLRALDGARAKLGLGPYQVPKDFVALVPARQWLILSDLDRLTYRLPPIGGLALALDRVAKAGALAHSDPDPLPLLRQLHNEASIGFASNWAGGQPNALIAYYGWMYDDGYGGPNIDCSTPSGAGCWGHRHDILAFAQGGALVMGAAALGGANSYALTIVDTTRPAWPYSYSWARAKRDGAGSG